VHKKNSLVVDSAEHFLEALIVFVFPECREISFLKLPQRKPVNFFRDLFERTVFSVFIHGIGHERVAQNSLDFLGFGRRARKFDQDL
jgi:hypothetical protein